MKTTLLDMILSRISVDVTIVLIGSAVQGRPTVWFSAYIKGQLVLLHGAGPVLRPRYRRSGVFTA